MGKIKGIEVTELTVGEGIEATKQNVALVNVRTFLRRGDEVPPLPPLGTRMLVDLGRREQIAGLCYCIVGMREGGARRLIISPHLAYGEAGLPGLIPPNALLRCEVELLKVRESNALLPEDFPPGQTMYFNFKAESRSASPDWRFVLHENGSGAVYITYPPEGAGSKPRFHIAAISVEASHAQRMIQDAKEIQNNIPEECLSADSPSLRWTIRDPVYRDASTGRPCMTIAFFEARQFSPVIAIPRDSPKFLASEFCKTILSLIEPYLSKAPVSP